MSYRSVYVDLPVSLGVEFLNKYKEDPGTYSNPTSFAEFFPGMYITNSYGSGRIMKIANTQIKLYYHSKQTLDNGNDTTYSAVGNYFAVTPEIITNNNIDLRIADEVIQMAENGDNVVLAPAGMDLEITFPAREIIDKYRENSGNLAVINTLEFEIPAERIANDYGIEPPPYLLLIRSSDKDSFFANDDITDNRSSFYGEYDSSTKKYVFTDMRSYLLDLISKDEITDDDVTFTITPVSLTTESVSSSYYYYSTTEYIVEVAPYVDMPAMAKLSLDKAKIKLTFSRQTIDF